MDRNFAYQIAVFFILFACWIVFSGLFDRFHLMLGVVSCYLATWMSSDLMFRNRKASFRVRLREVLCLPGYMVWLIKEIFVANLHVLRLALEALADVHPVDAIAVARFYGVGSEPRLDAPQLAALLGRELNAVHLVLHAARRRLRVRIVAEVRGTTGRDADHDDEMRLIVAAIEAVRPGLTR